MPSERPDYNEYISSSAWAARREQYWAEATDPECFVCARPRFSGIHLHHRSYKRLGAEKFGDLVPACQPCHALIHNIERKAKLGLYAATDVARQLVRHPEGPGSKIRSRAYKVALGEVETARGRYAGYGPGHDDPCPLPQSKRGKKNGERKRPKKPKRRRAPADPCLSIGRVERTVAVEREEFVPRHMRKRRKARMQGEDPTWLRRVPSGRGSN